MCVSGLPLTDNAYKDALQLLKTRFGNENIIINAYTDALIKMKKPMYNAETLRPFYDNINAYMRALQQYGQTNFNLLVPIIFDKLPDKIRFKITEAKGSDKLDLEFILHSLLTAVTALEQVKSMNDHSIQEYSTAACFTTGSRRIETSNRERYYEQQQTRCPLCDQNHNVFSCTTYSTPQNRSRRAKDLHLCINCLRSHSTDDCLSTNRCQNCKYKHHTTLCYKNNQNHPSKDTDVEDEVNPPDE